MSSDRVAMIIAVLEKRAELRLAAEDIFVNIAGSQSRGQFTADNARRALLVGTEGLARVIKTKGDAAAIAKSVTLEIGGT